jgi:hypothetical protein
MILDIFEYIEIMVQQKKKTFHFRIQKHRRILESKIILKCCLTNCAVLFAYQ